MGYRLLALSIAGLSTMIAAPVVAVPSGQSGTGVDQSAHPTDRATGALTTSRANYIKGHRVEFTFVVQNPTSSTVHYDFATGQQFDVTIVDPHGVEIWKWSQDRLFTQQLTALDLRPGESKTYSAIWDTGTATFVPAGQYTATATLTPTVRPAIRGGMLVDPVRDPDNVGQPTLSTTESGQVIQVNVTHGVSATAKFMISRA